jgi:hypothetical protein
MRILDQIITIVIGIILAHLMCTGVASFVTWENYIFSFWGNWEEGDRFLYFIMTGAMSVINYCILDDIKT